MLAPVTCRPWPLRSVPRVGPGSSPRRWVYGRTWPRWHSSSAAGAWYATRPDTLHASGRSHSGSRTSRL